MAWIGRFIPLPPLVALVCIGVYNPTEKGRVAGLDRIRGSHHQMRHLCHPHTITVPHPKKELGKGLVNAILKQAKMKE